MVTVLYLSYDGALDPLGQSQVVPYVTGLASLGFRMCLVSFEKPESLRDSRRVGDLKESPVSYTHLTLPTKRIV